MKYTPFLLLLSLIISCHQKPSCELLAQLASNNACIIIVTKLPDDIFFSAKGINPFTNEECKCSDGDRWWIQYKDEINIKDTIIKRKGELTFNIHKKDTIISHEWKCDGKTYNPDGTIKN